MNDAIYSNQNIAEAVRMRDDVTAYIMRRSEQGEGIHQLADRI